MSSPTGAGLTNAVDTMPWALNARAAGSCAVPATIGGVLSNAAITAHAVT
ncbi:hypothetical protein [Mycobacterium sp. M23085]